MKKLTNLYPLVFALVIDENRTVYVNGFESKGIKDARGRNERPLLNGLNAIRYVDGCNVLLKESEDDGTNLSTLKFVADGIEETFDGKTFKYDTYEGPNGERLYETPTDVYTLHMVSVGEVEVYYNRRTVTIIQYQDEAGNWYALKGHTQIFEAENYIDDFEDITERLNNDEVIGHARKNVETLVEMCEEINFVFTNR